MTGLPYTLPTFLPGADGDTATPDTLAHVDRFSGYIIARAAT